MLYSNHLIGFGVGGGKRLTPSTSANWTGTANATYSGDDLAITAQGGLRHAGTYLVGDFEFTFTATNGGGAGDAFVAGVFPVSEVGTFSAASGNGGMASMTNSLFFQGQLGGTPTIQKGGSSLTTFSLVSTNVVKFVRTGGTVKITRNGSDIYTFVGSYTADLYACFASGNGSLDADDISWLV